VAGLNAERYLAYGQANWPQATARLGRSNPASGLDLANKLPGMVMSRQKRLGIFLFLVGIALLVIAVAALFRAQVAHQTRRTRRTSVPRTVQAPASPVATSAVSGRAIRLGPTAAAAATRLPPPTPVPTAGPLPSRPSAPLRIVIPPVGLDATVVEVGWRVVRTEGEAHGMWDTVAAAAGHHRGSADPGQAGNCVISAHSSDAGGAVFRRLDEVADGDVVELHTVNGQRYEYVVTTVLTLDELSATLAEKREHARWLDPTDAPVLTLVTCWPAWSYTYRIVVRANLSAP